MATGAVDLLDHPSLRVVRGELQLKKIAVPQNYPEKIIKVVGNTPCQLADGFHLLGLPESFVHYFCTLAC
jgi:hypothetical protein